MKHTIPFFCIILLGFLLIQGCTSHDDIPIYKSMDDVADKSIAVLMGSTHEKFIMKNYEKANIMRFETSPDLAVAVESGRVDVALMDEILAKSLASTNENIGILIDKLNEELFGAAFNYDNLELRKQFNDFIVAIKEDGMYDEIYNRWLLNLHDTIMPKIDLPTEGDVLVVGTSGTDFPFSFYKNNELNGFDIEIVTRFAQYLNRPLELKNINFGGLIASLSSKKIEMIISSMTVTEERAKLVAFSDSYVSSWTVVVANTKHLSQGKTLKGKDITFWEGLKGQFHDNLVKEDRYKLILSGLKETLVIFIFSSVLATLLGAVLCYMARSNRKILNWLADKYALAIQGIPVLVLLMILYYIIFASSGMSATLVSVIALGIYFAVDVSDLFNSAISSIDKGQREAGLSMGFSKIQTFFYIVFPQALKIILPLYISCLIGLLKTTSIVGYIAISDLTRTSDLIRSCTFDAFFPLIVVAVIYFVLARFLSVGLKYVYTKIDIGQS